MSIDSSTFGDSKIVAMVTHGLAAPPAVVCIRGWEPVHCVHPAGARLDKHGLFKEAVYTYCLPACVPELKW